ncbi:MAG: CDP-2,3-bis-(O-geranylgeranyl)-sn-glycerol synthase [Halobacteriota archaeon]
MVLDLVVGAFWAMLPAYVPNNAAVLGGGGRPIDGGRTWRGRRLLGDGKTWRGTIVGVVAGSVLAVVLNLVNGPLSTLLGFSLPVFPLRAGVALAVGAMVGDVVASLLKRRLGRERGSAVPVLDQLDFVVGALVLTAFVAPSWFAQTFTPAAVGVVLVMTPLLHVGTNALAFLFGLKNEPW